MESSDTETGMVDCSVGTIVWVRRRNGSWWPGKILGSEELSASHLMSPRSGTPVKLLGREDASVDWYNLEKSKRVKPFRCGVFDDCIERAEASQGMPPKKREKYARREDAILHALELEKQLLEKKYGKLGLSSNGANGNLQGDVGKETSPELACDSGKHSDSKMDLSLEDKKKGISLQARRVEKGSQLGVDDENSDVQPRMRGLQDIGLSSVPSIHKVASSVASNGSHKYAPDGIHAHLGSLAPKNSSPLVNSKNLLDKRKRSHDGFMEESLSKRRDRRRPLIQVLESSAKLPRPHSSQLQADGGSVAALVLEEEQREHSAKGSNDAEMAALDNKFDSKETLFEQMGISTSKSERRDITYPVGLIEQHTSESTEDTETDSSGTESLESDTDDAMTALSDEAEHIELIPKSFGRSEPQGEHESMSDEDIDYLGYHDGTRESQLTNATVSKWQLKGKRNNRYLTKRYPDTSGRKIPTGSFQEARVKEEETYHYDNYDSFEKNIRIQGHRDIINWEDFSWNNHFECYDPVSEGHHLGRRMLMDVELKVQSSYQREHVPMISLMSKLNGKAIVGHPIPVETLENGTCESILSANESEPLEYDTPLQPWRTARRTAKCRVPRPPLSTLEEDEDSKPPLTGPPAKVIKKAQRKMSSNSSQKIRALSSIGTQPKAESSSGYEEVMKPESLPTAVACIPVKLVFSRLHEGLS